jgi:predicted Fe-Mo cluster-binding NifX family protein
MAMCLAISVWNNRVAPLFDSSATCLLFSQAGTGWQKQGELHLAGKEQVARASTLLSAGVRRLVCGALSCDARQALCHKNIEVFAFVSGEVAEVLRALECGDLCKPLFTMPGCGRPQHWQHQSGPRASHKPEQNLKTNKEDV